VLLQSLLLQSLLLLCELLLLLLLLARRARGGGPAAVPPALLPLSQFAHAAFMSYLVALSPHRRVYIAAMLSQLLALLAKHLNARSLEQIAEWGPQLRLVAANINGTNS
jgi:hypothetical protein